MIIILLFLKFQFLEAQKDGGNFQDLVHTLGLERLGIGQWTLQDWSGSEISKIAAELVPDWMRVLVQSYCEAGMGMMSNYNAELCLLAIVVGTMMVLTIVSSCLSRRKWEVPLVKRIAEMDRKLFVANAELAICQKDVVDATNTARKEGEMVKVLDVQLDKVGQELLNAKEEGRVKEGKNRDAERQFEIVKEKVARSQLEIAQNKDKAEELLEKKNVGEEQLREKEAIVQQLGEQLEDQKELVGKYEAVMKGKVKENTELSNEIELAQEELNKIKIKIQNVKEESYENRSSLDQCEIKVTEMERKEEDWKSLSDLLQSQLDDKSEVCDGLEIELAAIRSRLSVIEVESENKQKELQVLQEALEEVMRKNEDSAEADGWDLDDDCLASFELEEVKEGAKLRIENRNYIEKNEILEKKVDVLKIKLNEVSHQAGQIKSEVESLREGKEKAAKEQTDAERKLEILTEFFNKKESELHKQLGLQSAKFGNVSSEAEISAKKLVAMTGELELTRGQLDMLKRELEDQEMCLKAAYLVEEKKAQENWIAARQAERRVTEMQKEMSVLRNRLTEVEGRKENIVGVIKKEENGINLKQDLNTLPPLPGLPGLATSTYLPQSDLPSLAPLPPLPGMSHCFPPIPGLLPGPNDYDFSLSFHPNQDNNISFASRRTRSRSNSPDQRGFVESQVWTRSPSPELSRFRSDWCGYSQARTRSPSPDHGRLRSDQSHQKHASRRSPLQERFRQDDRDRYDGSCPDSYSDQRGSFPPVANRHWRFDSGEGQIAEY